jgi:hypothetical protein
MEDKVYAELADVFRDLETLLKNPEVGEVLAGRGVNISLAMVAADGLQAYLRGEKAKAAEELATAAEEIASRMAAAKGGGVS